MDPRRFDALTRSLAALRSRPISTWAAKSGRATPNVIVLALTILLASNLALNVRAASEAAVEDCRGAAEWLTESEERFRPFDPLLDELVAALGITHEELFEFGQDDSAIAESMSVEELSSILAAYGDVLPQWADAAIRAMQEQAASDYPPAAVQFNAQLVSALSTFAISFETMDTALGAIEPGVASQNAVEAIAEAEADGVRQVAKAVRLARELKQECQLLTSGEEFAAGCYGDAALQWYLRTDARLRDVTSFPGGAESVTATAATRSRQEQDLPPPAFRDLQAIYLSLYDLINLADVGEIELSRVEQEVYRIGAELDSEKARLDTACTGSGSRQNVSLSQGAKSANDEPPSMGGAPDAMSGGSAGESPEHDRILAACASSPLYPVGATVTTESEGFLATTDGRNPVIPRGKQLRITGPLIERGICDAWPVEVAGTAGQPLSCVVRECASVGNAGVVSEVVFQADADQT